MMSGGSGGLVGPVASWVPSALRAQDSGPLLLQLRSLQTQLCPGVQAFSVEVPPPPVLSWSAWRFSDYTVARSPSLVVAAPFARRPVLSARLLGLAPAFPVPGQHLCLLRPLQGTPSPRPAHPRPEGCLPTASCPESWSRSLGGDFPTPVSSWAPQPGWPMLPWCVGPWGQSPVCTRLGELVLPGRRGSYTRGGAAASRSFPRRV